MQGKDVGVVPPKVLLRQWPDVHAVHAAAPDVMDVPATVCVVLTVYDPAPPAVPETNAVMVVPATTPMPESVAPTASVPDATAVTVSVVNAMDAVTDAA